MDNESPNHPPTTQRSRQLGVEPNDGAPDPWHVHPIDPHVGGDDFGRLLASVRRMQDRFVAALVPGQHIDALIGQLDALGDAFDRWHVAERESPGGSRNDLPGRGNLLLPPFIIDEITATSMRGRITFTRFHVGGNGAAHGGTVPLMFDDVLGRVVNGPDRPVARTAYLNVNYRSVTMMNVEHRLEAEATRVEGRKRFAVGKLFAGDVLTAEAEALFVELKPGQP
jgi:acyl-coenzyme A thioesterase PaaI-like protein